MKKIIILGLCVSLILISGCIFEPNEYCTVDYNDSNLVLIGHYINVTINGYNYGECCCTTPLGICDCENK